MEREAIRSKLTEIFRDVFEKAELEIGEATTAADIPAWDSLAHIHLIVAVERGFGIRFSSREMQSWDHVGEMMDCIAEKLSQKA